jgi:catechol 2,3-dioxygenase-like lactoylglutathione lyase family enzyme
LEKQKKGIGFKIDFLDHVAIRVQDMEVSAAWYEKVLGLMRYQLPAWGDYPIFMLAGTSGIALFPADTKDPLVDRTSRNVKIDHFAFHVGRDAFESAQQHYESLGQEFQFQDHHYFHSIYTKDPDGHTVELTTLLVDPEDFYRD